MMYIFLEFLMKFIVYMHAKFYVLLSSKLKIQFQGYLNNLIAVVLIDFKQEANYHITEPAYMQDPNPTALELTGKILVYKW
jgi:hypothetical protein